MFSLSCGCYLKATTIHRQRERERKMEWNSRATKNVSRKNNKLYAFPTVRLVFAKNRHCLPNRCRTNIFHVISSCGLLQRATYLFILFFIQFFSLFTCRIYDTQTHLWYSKMMFSPWRHNINWLYLLAEQPVINKRKFHILLLVFCLFSSLFCRNSLCG